MATISVHPNTIERLCVFCGSSEGTSPAYRQGALALSDAMKNHHISLVYGGGNRGIMGAIASSLYGSHVQVTGIIPKLLHNMLNCSAYPVDELIIVEDMHERKKRMYAMSDAFVALPGGIGTLEELMEIYTWLQLGYHKKPVGILNIDGYYNALLNFLDHITNEGFLSPAVKGSLFVEEDPNTLLANMRDYSAELPHKLS